MATAYDNKASNDQDFEQLLLQSSTIPQDIAYLWNREAASAEALADQIRMYLDDLKIGQPKENTRRAVGQIPRPTY
jgi:hypothetical protein